MDLFELDSEKRGTWLTKSLDRSLEEEILSNEVFLRIINSNEFLRLKNISFMGAIDYLSSGKKLSRYRHSIDVAKLALFVSKERNYSDTVTEHLIVAGLLHDIGHAPFSHSIESSFKEEFGIDHHAASCEILHGKITNLSKLNSILKKNFDLDLIINLINQTSKETFSDLFNSKFNIDTLDGIDKSTAYFNSSKTFNKYEVALAAFTEQKNNSHCLDAFWKQKDHTYKNLINSGIGAIADHLSKQYFYDNKRKIDCSYFYKNEQSLLLGRSPIFKNFSEKLQSINTSEKNNDKYITIEIFERDYYKSEENSIPLDKKNIEEKYLHRKKLASKVIYYKIKESKKTNSQLDLDY